MVWGKDLGTIVTPECLGWFKSWGYMAINCRRTGSTVRQETDCKNEDGWSFLVRTVRDKNVAVDENKEPKSFKNIQKEK